jgi:hypothetical protein
VAQLSRLTYIRKYQNGLKIQGTDISAYFTPPSVSEEKKFRNRAYSLNVLFVTDAATT